MLKEPSFRRKHSVALRLWHWSTFIIISGSLFTVLLASTIFRTRDNVAAVKDNLKENSITVSDDQARDVAHLFNDKLWEWHIYFGYVLAGLFFLRIVLEFFQVADQKLFRTIKNARLYLRQANANSKNTKHFLYVKYLYLFFYLTLFVMACTGLFMAYSDDVEELRAKRDIAKQIHSIGMYVILSYIGLHLIGIVVAEFRKDSKGIISDMVNGGEENKE